MKVTDEMVERACAVTFLLIENDAYVRKQMRFALEAALADVPELSAAERGALFVHGRDKDRIEAQHQRIAGLEAENARLRKHGEACEEVLRDVASHLGCGGHNAPRVDPEVFRAKIYDGIGDLEAECARLREQLAEAERAAYREKWGEP